MSIMQWGVCGSGGAIVLHLVVAVAGCLTRNKVTMKWNLITNTVFAVAGFGAGALAGVLWNL